MYNTLSKKGQLLAVGLGVFSLLLFLLPVFSGLAEFNSLSDEDQINSGIFNTGLRITLLLIIVSVFGWISFSIFQMATNFSKAKKGLMGLLGLLILFFILYSTSEAETSGPLKAVAEEFALSDGSSKLVSGAIKTTAVLGFGAIIALVVSEIRNFFK
jgi:uncharacterized membrane protein